jgi:uncharacterized SAM-dependent methyltransferase
MAAQVQPKLPLQIISLLREQEILAQLRCAFAERYLPEHLFYWLPTSVTAWVELCRSSEYRNANRALQALRIAAPKMAEWLRDIKTLCGLGCGEGSKDALLLKAFAESGSRLTFVAADFSQALLELALEDADQYCKFVTGTKFNVNDNAQLAAVCNISRELGAPVLYTVLGNTLGAFGPTTFSARLREQLQPGDRFLFDGEIFSPHTLAGYDNPVNRRFAWGPLTGVGITEADGQLQFATETLEGGLHAVTKHFVATRNLRVNLGGEAIEIHAGEKLKMSSSIKYSTQEVLLDCVKRAGFRVSATWKSEDRQFVLGLAE